MKQQRKTIKLNESFLAVAEALNQQDRLIYYERILKHFLKGDPLSYENASDTLRVALLCSMPQIRALQSKFENGKCEKNIIRKSKATLCPKTEANLSESKRPMDPNNLLDYINNLIIDYHTSAQADTHARDTAFKNNVGAVSTSLNQLFNKDISTYNQFKNLILKITKEKEIKVSGKILTKEAALKFISALMQSPNGGDIIQTCIKNVNETPGINNKDRYAFSMLYNKFYNTTTHYPGFQEHQYSKEFLNSLYDEL